MLDCHLHRRVDRAVSEKWNSVYLKQAFVFIAEEKTTEGRHDNCGQHDHYG